MDISAIVSQMAVLFLIIAIGYLAAKCKVFPEGTNKILAQLVICVTNPCTVLFSVLGSQRQLSNREVLLLTGIAIIMYAVLILLGFLLPSLLRCPKEDRNLYRFMSVFSNVGFLGFPVVNSIYGPNAVFYAGIFNLVFQLVVYTYGVALLDSAKGPRKLPLKNIFSPMIIASVVAYICYLTDFRIPGVITDTLEMLSNVTSAVCMLVIGIALASVPIRQVFSNWRLYVLCLVRLFALPVGAYFLLRLFVENQLILGITVVMAGMPIATLSTLFTAKYGGNEKLAASGVFLSTTMSLFSIPLIMWLLFA